MKNIVISSTSFLIPKNGVWDKFKNRFKLLFSEYGKINTIIRSNKHIFCEILNIFLPDIIDYYNTNYNFERKKILIICKIIEKKIKTINTNLIVTLSEFYFFNVIDNAKNFRVSKELKQLFLSNLYRLSKKNKNIYIVDLDEVFSNTGYENCFDNRNFSLFRCRLSVKGLEILSQKIFDLINRIKESNKKVLLLDCDNTIWGGVVSEDGVEKIQVGQDGIGLGYLNFQKSIKKIKDSGILIVLVSKNEISVVKNVFKKNKYMILKENDITAFRINWVEKSKNILDLSKDLMLGLDSFVFWDDNPIEREKIKKTFKEIEVIEPDEDVSNWYKQLLEYEGFSKFSKTKEDSAKTQQYKNREKFFSNKKIFKDEIEYLKSINIKPKNEFLNTSNLDRAVQLMKKTNQFNFSNLSYNHDQIKFFAKSNICFLTHLIDNYGDHGLISLVCAKIYKNNFLYVENFLMSCRILGRYLEFWILNKIKEIAKKRKLNNIMFLFNQTKKNQPAKNFILQAKLEEVSKFKLQKLEFLNKNDNKIKTGKYYILDVNKKIPFLEAYER